MILMCNQDLNQSKEVDYDSKKANENACIHNKSETTKIKNTNSVYP